VNPAALFTEVGHFQEIRIETGGLEHLPESGFMKPWGTGSHYNAVKVVFEYIFFDLLLARFGTGITDIFGDHDIIQAGSRFSHFPAVHGLGNIQTAVAHVHADASGSIHIISFFFMNNCFHFFHYSH
jgi:hypothetical protein